jgi:hypothetical protein
MTVEDEDKRHRFACVARQMHERFARDTVDPPLAMLERIIRRRMQNSHHPQRN